MQVFCSNCNTAHEVTQAQASDKERSIIHCSKCDKKIKLQFCPHCGSFYSITFANIKTGRYRYRCRKCMKDFAIEFYEERPKPVLVKKPPLSESLPAFKEPEHFETQSSTRAEHTAPAEKIEVAKFINNSINSFSINELFAAAAGAFSLNRILVASSGVIIMLLLMTIFSRIETLWLSGGTTLHPFAGSLIALLPLAIIFSLYTATAAIISRITLDIIFHDRPAGWDEIIRFSFRTAPAVFLGNTAALLAMSAILILFGKIPMLGPVIFALIFLPVYLSGILITLLFSIGIWFYPPISAHREGGISGNIKNLMLFIRKHNLGLLYMIPVIILVSLISVSAIFLIHTTAFSLTISLSQWLLGNDGGGVFASIPASFVKASEATVSGLGNGLFRQLSINIGMTHHVSGFILGIIMMFITTLLLSIAVSVTATVSTHIYIVMERGLTIDDKKKGAVFLILTLMLSVMLLLKKLI
ncbi:MAG TPA: hypothetical protein PKZ64_09725 [Spirochaetota bacterium]|nr:hypothetical protein [Spirochaetota bacterium]